MKDDIKVYLIKHAIGYELDATRCREAYARIVSLEEQVAKLESDQAYLLNRLADIETQRFESSRSRRTYEA